MVWSGWLKWFEAVWSGLKWSEVVWSGLKLCEKTVIKIVVTLYMILLILVFFCCTNGNSDKVNQKRHKTNAKVKKGFHGNLFNMRWKSVCIEPISAALATRSMTAEHSRASNFVRQRWWRQVVSSQLVNTGITCEMLVGATWNTRRLHIKAYDTSVCHKWWIWESMGERCEIVCSGHNGYGWNTPNTPSMHPWSVEACNNQLEIGKVAFLKTHVHLHVNVHVHVHVHVHIFISIQFDAHIWGI